MVMFLPRYLIGPTVTTCSAVVMKFLGKYRPMCCNPFMCERGNIHMTKQHSYILPNCVSEKIIYCIRMDVVARESDW